MWNSGTSFTSLFFAKSYALSHHWGTVSVLYTTVAVYDQSDKTIKAGWKLG